MQANYEFIGTKRDLVIGLPSYVNGFGFTTVEHWAYKQFNMTAATLQRLVNATKQDRIAYLNETEVQMELVLR